jgi:segregation and condensation protein A
LPRDPSAAEEEFDEDDPRKELVDRLLEYEKYKASGPRWLYEKTTIEQAVFARGKDRDRRA